MTSFCVPSYFPQKNINRFGTKQTQSRRGDEYPSNTLEHEVVTPHLDIVRSATSVEIIQNPVWVLRVQECRVIDEIKGSTSIQSKSRNLYGSQENGVRETYTLKVTDIRRMHPSKKRRKLKNKTVLTSKCTSTLFIHYLFRTHRQWIKGSYHCRTY